VSVLSKLSPFTGDLPAAALGFARSRLDRQAGERTKPEPIAAWLEDEAARFVLLTADAILLSGGERRSPLFARAERDALGEPIETLFLGVDETDRFPIFASLFESFPQDPEQAMADERIALDLRAIASQGLLPPDDLGLLASARGLSTWHLTHPFCARCGAKTAAADGGWKRHCDACGADHFPRTDPVVIMLAIDGERCLLGRQPRFPPGMYSALAGFMEPGETIEAAVRREILEEAGIRTGAVGYLGSQPWAFPMSLMIGCAAEARSTDIMIDRDELEDARWFGKDEIRAMIAGTHPEGLKAPNPLAIAHHLLLAFLGEGRRAAD
jgi:NAD+ diphosphatase